ncbi:hypothetical protein VSX64_22235 [Aurantimonas sp. C2-6-R+9]|nr:MULTISPECIES: hypothetical protein [unclassified Aurantimonas]MEC5292944.1 hypothetical protein [Aurantimonas sp. C2-3-R2]MEC5383500.1 hypothetical protein [Aurantimonas sp. C2-6-R+9]MEC5414573.1 hypothetical protein [Aurantimonas sp. C2-4-R8]
MTTTFHSHWRDVLESVWRWPNVSPAEIARHGAGVADRLAVPAAS